MKVKYENIHMKIRFPFLLFNKKLMKAKNLSRGKLKQLCYNDQYTSVHN